jgi:hypothetical protein
MSAVLKEAEIFPARAMNDKALDFVFGRVALRALRQKNTTEISQVEPFESGVAIYQLHQGTNTPKRFRVTFESVAGDQINFKVDSMGRSQSLTCRQSCDSYAESARTLLSFMASVPGRP